MAKKGQTKMTTKQKQKQTHQDNGSLAERVMIVKRTVNQWTGFVVDRSIARYYASHKKADSRMFSSTKMLIDKHAMDEIHQVASEGYALHRQRTLPWNDGGYRILSSEAYFDYMAEQRECRVKFDAAVDRFVTNWGAHVEKGKELLGSAANNYAYPTAEQVRQRFSYTVQPLPLPTAQDFRVQLGSVEVEAVRETIEQEQREVIRAAMREPFQRLHQLIAHMVERLEAYQVTAKGKTTNSFKNSLVENIRELVNLMPQLNVTRDPALVALTEEAKALLVDPDALRGNARMRKHTADEASKILDKLNAFI
jgi:hypothetical protein